MSTGQCRSITSCHAGRTDETFTRHALMCLQNPQGQCVPFNIIKDMLRDLIDVVVRIDAHFGQRHITDVYFKEFYKESTK